MPLSTEQITLVRKNFRLVEPIAPQAAALFYERLFEIAPEVRPLFTHDMDKQGKKLMQMIAVAVANLDNLEEIMPAVRALGKRHVAYGVEPDHYAAVGAALLWTLEKALGYAFTPEAREAWTQVYGLLAGAMQAPQPEPNVSAQVGAPTASTPPLRPSRNSRCPADRG
jgi:hemoglobin-like flavoprotein